MIVLYDVIANIFIYRKLQPKIALLYNTGRKLNLSLASITQSYLDASTINLL